MDGRSEPTTAKPRGEAPLSRLLEGVLVNLGLRSRFREHLALLAWPQIAGPVIGSRTRAEAVRDGVLIVAADTSAWAQELQMRRHELLARIAQQVGPGLIRDLHFRAGGAARGRRSRPAHPRPVETKLSPRQQKQIAEAAAHIPDPQLRARAERAFLSLARISQWRKDTGWRRCARCGQWQRVGRRWCASCAHAGARQRRK
jgi:predicted nucleic acid-binding Zn ribbon protein